MQHSFLIPAIFLFGMVCKAQKNQSEGFSTFGVIARDSIDKSWGVAIATNNLGVGQHGVFEIKPDVGIVVSIAFTEPNHPARGIALLEKGYSLTMTIDSLLKGDDIPTYRQIAIMDKTGRATCYTGNTIQAYTVAGYITDRNIIVFGNSFLNPQALQALLRGYKTSGRLYQRLFNALSECQKAGGQNSGKMSAAICVRKSGESGFNDADMRIDYSISPFDDLKKLVDKRYGLEILQLARKTTNNDSAIFLLSKAAKLFEGWTLTYTEVSKEFFKRKRPDLAVELLRQGIKKDKLFRNCLPWNYFLIDNRQYQDEIKRMKFDLHDWLEAIGSLIDVGHYKLAETTAKNVLISYPDVSHLYLLLGRSLDGQQESEQAQINYRKAVALDSENLEARQKIK